MITVCPSCNLYMGWAYDITICGISKSALLERIGLHFITKAAVSMYFSVFCLLG